MERTTRRAAFGAIGSIAAAGLIAGHAAQAAATPADRSAWERLVATEREAFATFDAIGFDDAPACSAAEDAWQEAQSAMMRHPAPDLAALRHKLDRLFPADEDGDETACWSWDFAGQTIADMRRLLPNAEA